MVNLLQNMPEVTWAELSEEQASSCSVQAIFLQPTAGVCSVLDEPHPRPTAGLFSSLVSELSAVNEAWTCLQGGRPWRELAAGGRSRLLTAGKQLRSTGVKWESGKRVSSWLERAELLILTRRAANEVSQGQQTGGVASCSAWINCGSPRCRTLSARRGLLHPRSICTRTELFISH